MRWLLTSMPGGKLRPWAARVAAARLTFRGRSVVVGREANDEGIDDSFELEFEVPEKVQTGLFVGDCFVYTTHSMRLNYVVGGKVTTLHHLGESPPCAARSRPTPLSQCALRSADVFARLSAQGEPALPD